MIPPRLQRLFLTVIGFRAGGEEAIRLTRELRIGLCTLRVFFFPAKFNSSFQYAYICTLLVNNSTRGSAYL